MLNLNWMYFVCCMLKLTHKKTYLMCTLSPRFAFYYYRTSEIATAIMDRLTDALADTKTGVSSTEASIAVHVMRRLLLTVPCSV